MTHPQETSVDIGQIFNAIALVYDQINDQMTFGLHRAWKKLAVQMLQVSPGAMVLDLCCGTGDLAFLLERQVGVTGQVYGVDFAAQMLAQARTRDPQRRIRWLEADVLELPFEDQQFEGITLGFGLRNVTDIPRCLSEIHRVLRPGGRVAILDLHRPRDLGWRAFQAWYLEQRVVTLGRNSNLTKEYTYLAPSLDRFPDGWQQEHLAFEAGFSHARHYRLMGGSIGILRLVH